jgi:hypothetical protein
MRQTNSSGATVSSAETSARAVPTEQIANTPANANATLRIVLFIVIIYLPRRIPSMRDFSLAV